jgi:hypothetical protein
MLRNAKIQKERCNKCLLGNVRDLLNVTISVERSDRIEGKEF